MTSTTAPTIEETVQTSGQFSEEEFINLLQSVDIKVETKSLSSAEYIQESLKSRQRSGLYIALSGMYLYKAQKIEGYGFIASEAKRLGIARQTLYNDIDVFNMYARFPQESVQILDTLNSSKILFLKHFDDEELTELVKGEEVRGITLDDVQTFPTREIERRFKEYETSNNELEQKLVDKDKELALTREENRLLKLKQNEVAGFIYPDSVEKVRVEASVLTSQALQCLDDMEQFISLLVEADDLDPDLAKREAQFSAGSSTLFVNLNTIYGKASYLLRVFNERIGLEDMPTLAEDTPLLTKEEALAVSNMREVMLAEHQAAAEARERARTFGKNRADK